jgi:hypothetical protein
MQSKDFDRFLDYSPSQPVGTRRAKIVCTLGPSSNTEAMIRQLMRAGMDVARLNFSHGTHEEQANDEPSVSFRICRAPRSAPAVSSITRRSC